MHPKTTVESFWSKVDKSGECWIYQGTPDKDGYCHASFAGIHTTAHRIAFYLEHGFWPVIGCHNCDNPPCVRPSHIYNGDNFTNSADRYKRGRVKKPTNTKLTWIQVDEIIAKWKAGGISQTELGKLYNVDRSSISRTVRGLYFKKHRYNRPED